jgi:hypothetical protein
MIVSFHFLNRTQGGTSRPALRQVGYAYAITAFALFGFQRLEAVFLQRRSNPSELAAYGLAFDASQVVRGAATAAFAVLIPIFVRELRLRRESTIDTAHDIAVGTAAAVAATAALALIAGAAADVSRSVLGGVPLSSVAGILASTAVLAGANVVAQLLLASRLFGHYLVIMAVPAVAAVFLNSVITHSAASASLTVMLVAEFFLGATAWAICHSLQAHRRLASYVKIALMGPAAAMPTLVSTGLTMRLMLTLVILCLIGLGTYAEVSRCLRVLLNGRAEPVEREL